jgi:hypothetical protein
VDVDPGHLNPTSESPHKPRQTAHSSRLLPSLLSACVCDDWVRPFPPHHLFSFSLLSSFILFAHAPQLVPLGLLDILSLRESETLASFAFPSAAHFVLVPPPEGPSTLSPSLCTHSRPTPECALLSLSSPSLTHTLFALVPPKALAVDPVTAARSENRSRAA